MTEKRQFWTEGDTVVGESVEQRLIIKMQTHQIPIRPVYDEFLNVVDGMVRLQRDSLQLKIRQCGSGCSVNRVKIVPVFKVQRPGSVVPQEDVGTIEIPRIEACVTL